jgi:serine/threonine protein kinase
MKNIVKKFETVGTFEKIEPFGNGDINLTYLCYFKNEDGSTNKYLLQRINSKVFKNIEGLMKNIKLVSEYLLKTNDSKYTMHLIPTKTGEYYYFDEEIKKYFRMYNFINNTKSYDYGNVEINYEAAKMIGKFQKNLVGFKSYHLIETIPYFHDSHKRYEDLQFATLKDNNYRVRYVEEELAFIEKRKEILDDITELIRNKKIPLKTCHNDTKINNILFDVNTNKGVCMVDFDTIMEGTVLYDFGDAIRFCCNEGKEDETILDKVKFNLDYFESFVKGYLEECKDLLNDYEKANLVKSCIIITLECGIRFLTDYINGDVYFIIEREHENLDKAKVHFRLVEQMEENREKMEEIVKKYL